MKQNVILITNERKTTEYEIRVDLERRALVREAPETSIVTFDLNKIATELIYRFRKCF